MPIYQTIQNLLQQQAQTEDIQAQTQQRRMASLLQQRSMDQQDYIRQQLGMLNGGQPPGVQAGGVPGGQTTQDANADPLENEMQQIQNLRNQAIQRAKIFQSGPYPNFKEADEAQKQVDTLTTQAREAATRTVDQQAKRSQQLVQSFGGVQDQDTFQNVMGSSVRAAARNPQLQQALQPILTSVDFDPNTGQPIYNDRAKGAIKVLMAQQTTADQQAQLANTALLRQIEQGRLAQTEANQQEQRRQEDQRIAIMQTHANAALESAAAARAGVQDRHEDTMNARKFTQAQTISGSYRSDPEVTKFQDNAAAYKGAKSYLFTQDDAGNVVMKPNSAFDAPGDSAFVHDYFKVAYPERQMRSVTELKGVDKMAGVPTRILQGIQNIFTGKEVPNDVKAEMFRAMDNKFQQDNAQQIQREDTTLAKVQNLKLPDGVTPDPYVPQYSIRAKTAAQTTPNAGLPRVSSDADFDKLPSGQRFIDPNGVMRTKP